MRRQVKDPKRSKRKYLGRLPGRMEWKTHLITSKPRKRNLFSKEELVSSDIEEIAGCRSLSKRKKSFPKEKSVNDPEESGNKRVPKEKEKILFQGRPTQQWTLGGFC